MRSGMQMVYRPRSYRLEKIDIDERVEYLESHNVRVPVLECEKIEVCEHFLDLEALQNALAEARASYNRGSAVRVDH